MKTPKQLRREIHDLSSRRVRATEIDVFVQPGHALALTQGATNV